MADAFVACWDSKYHYWSIRPITAAKRLLGQDFKPPILTPPFPSYTSGHATFSGAASRVIGRYIPARAEELDRMAEEAAMSRLYGGIHFPLRQRCGIGAGRRIADWIGERGLVPVDVSEAATAR
ncbi:MAG: phosphatase PAP2 family protein [Ahniella sp.]|nr:phosphatase PAP2 family protein [Ahniella sp.]